MIRIIHKRSVPCLILILTTLFSVSAFGNMERELEGALADLEHSGHFFMKKEDLTSTSPQTLTQKETDEDIETMLEVFRKGYSVGVMAENPPEDIAPTRVRGVVGVYQDAILKLENYKQQKKEKITTESFARNLWEIISLIPDNHLLIKRNGKRVRNENKRLPVKDVGKNIAKGQKDRNWHREYKQIGDHAIPVLGITQMLSPGHKRYDGMMDQGFIRTLQDAKGIILDFRGNDGGSSPPIPLLKHLAQKTIRYPITYRLFSDEAIALKINLSRINHIAFPDQYDENFQLKLGFNLFLYKKMLALRNNTWAFEDHTISPIHSGFNGFICVLMDSYCASSTETAIYLLKQLSNVILVGDRTRGSFHFGGVGGLILPHSKLFLRVGTNFRMMDPSLISVNEPLIEKRGFFPTPGFALENGQDALTFTLKYLSKVYR